MKNKKGFTLVELLAVMVVLAIILAIAVPSVVGIIKSSTKGALKSDAIMLLQAIDSKKLENRDFNPATITKDNINSILGLNSDNYEQLNISLENNVVNIVIVGKNKWAGYTVYGTMKNMQVVDSDAYDVTPPAITIKGDNPVNIGRGSPYTDEGATATDIKDGDVAIESVIIKNASNEVVSSVDTSTFTTYTITYTAVDTKGNRATSIRQINIVDKTSPVITVSGSNPINVNVGTSYTDPGATALDDVDGNITNNIITTGTVNPNVMGAYTITYTVSDNSGNNTTTTRTVNVIDQNAPIITLLGTSPQSIYATSTYADEGATATDDIDGNLTNNIVTTGTVNPNMVGTYTITYNVTDNSGNSAVPVTRTVNVISNVFQFNYTGGSQTFTVPVTGNYKIELWGAQGGSSLAGPGGYTKGNITLSKDELLYLYVGQKGIDGNLKTTSSTTSVAVQTFNGGGAGGLAGGPYILNGTTYNYMFGSSGGGATDIRLSSGTWSDIASLRSRIMVAGGGGGNTSGVDVYNGSSKAGGLIGYTGDSFAAFPNSGGVGGTQTTGYAFGIGGPGDNAILTGGTGYGYCHGENGAGGGYYGGIGGHETGGNCYYMGGGGGSSFISGHLGSDAINSSGTHTGQPNHYSGKVFANTVMIDGAGYSWSNVKNSQVQMPKPDGSLYNLGQGHFGNGVAKITYLP